MLSGRRWAGRTTVPRLHPDRPSLPSTNVPAWRAMLAQPVVNEGGSVTGFVSRTDILRAVVHDPPLDLWT